jgi:hypothetical protein
MIHFLYWPDERDPRLPPEHLARQLAALADAGLVCSPLPVGVLSGEHALKGVPQGAAVVYRGPGLSCADYEQLTGAIKIVGARPFTTLEQYRAASRLSEWQPRLAEWTNPVEFVPDWRQLGAVLAKLPWPGAQVWSDTGPVLGTRGVLRPTDLADPLEAQALLDDLQCTLSPAELAAGLVLRPYDPAHDNVTLHYLVLKGTPHAPGEGVIPACVQRAAEVIDNPFFVVEVSGPTAALRIARIAEGQTAEVFGWPPQALAQLWQRATATD